MAAIATTVIPDPTDAHGLADILRRTRRGERLRLHGGIVAERAAVGGGCRLTMPRADITAALDLASRIDPVSLRDADDDRSVSVVVTDPDGGWVDVCVHPTRDAYAEHKAWLDEALRGGTRPIRRHRIVRVPRTEVRGNSPDDAGELIGEATWAVQWWMEPTRHRGHVAWVDYVDGEAEAWAVLGAEDGWCGHGPLSAVLAGSELSLQWTAAAAIGRWLACAGRGEDEGLRRPADWLTSATLARDPADWARDASSLDELVERLRAPDPYGDDERRLVQAHEAHTRRTPLPVFGGPTPPRAELPARRRFSVDAGALATHPLSWDATRVLTWGGEVITREEHAARVAAYLEALR